MTDWPDDMTDEDLQALAELDDERLQALFDVEDLAAPEQFADDVDDEPLQRSAAGYARPVTLHPRKFNPYRRVVDGPSVDDYEPAPPAEGEQR